MYKIFIFFLFCQVISLYSISPGKWSPMDKYVLGLEKNGPKQEVVKDKDGNVVYTAKYEYDEEGRLIRETYTKENGVLDGETVYTYERNKIATEELISSSGIQERKVYKYTTNGNLKEISIYSADGKETVRFKILAMSGDLVLEGEIRWLKLKETEYFSVKRDPENSKILIQEIFDEKKKQVAVVKYFLNEKNNIIKRENIQNQSKKMSEVSYDTEGKVTKFNFSVFKDNNWVLVKTHELIY
jgi:YD repeat-containing protein